MMDITNILLSCILPQLQHTGNNKWNSRCIICGDSKKNNSKKRFWILPSKNGGNNYSCYCFNCGYRDSLYNFLQSNFPDVWKDYIKLIYKKKGLKSKQKHKKEEIKETVTMTRKEAKLQKVSSFPNDHISNKFFEDRKLHPIWKNYLFYINNFKKWVNYHFPDKFEKWDGEEDKRIVIPFYTLEGKLFGVAGRALDSKDDLRYITIKFDENHPKIFGLERVDFKKTVYVTEGQFDSMFIPNCLAMGGSISNVKKLTDYAPKENFVLVPDLEPRNKEVCAFIDQSLKEGFKVALLPLTLKQYGKDINDIYKYSDLTIRNICDIINENTVYGIKGRIIFNSWKKI